ncbi:MAG: M14 family metallocarboxypeptidase [Bdellovibrionaceae bacterium]|nr:M14 family metallocarboxypeptidase [Pseudobdellovibrionaceae bacterium]
MAWQQVEKVNWFKQQKIQRSYQDNVVDEIQKLKSKFEIIQYGALSLDKNRYPLFLIRSQNFDVAKKTVFITGGVHGYETSGVHGALDFMRIVAETYEDIFNFVCAPCISPWSYETINRWNHQAIDPNRSFFNGSPAEECQFLIDATSNLKPFIHIDLHETTNTDNTIFRPALEQRDGVTHEFSPIPDGFYVVGDSENSQPVFQKAIIDAVRSVTHIAPPDEKGNIIGAKLEQEGVINYPVKKLFLCAGIFNPIYGTTTEVYPDSPKANSQICIEAQIAAIRGALDFAKNSIVTS